MHSIGVSKLELKHRVLPLESNWQCFDVVGWRGAQGIVFLNLFSSGAGFYSPVQDCAGPGWEGWFAPSLVEEGSSSVVSQFPALLAC